MKHLIKIIALISTLCIILGMLSGCSATKVTAELYDASNFEMVNEENGIVAENENFTMKWIKSTEFEGQEVDRAVVQIISKKDGTVWSTTPDEYIKETVPGDEWSPNMNLLAAELVNSALTITMRNEEQTMEYNAYSASIANGRFSSQKRENGITITYYFDQVGAIIPVDYYLEGEAFKVSVDPSKIETYMVEEALADKTVKVLQKVINVTPAPFICSSKNTNAGNKNDYVVVPSGSGALMYTDQRSDGAARTFEGSVYGADAAIDKYDSPKNETPVTMPFYGIKKGDKAVCAIIEQSAEACTIKARVGDSLMGANYTEAGVSNGYSNVAATYTVLGMNNVYESTSWREQFSEKVEKNLNPLVIGYYPLSGADANYTGMAKCYQKYLVEKEGMKKSSDNSLLTVKLYGSYLEDELFIGLPTSKDVALTTYEEATEILTELKNISGGSLIVNMYAYGEGGLNSTQLGGGYSLTGAVGGSSELEEFIKFTKDNGIKTFFNFDTVKFFESGSGYSTNDDAALNVNGVPAPLYEYWSSTRERYTIDQGGKVGTVIARDLLDDAANDAVELADEYGITGLSFDTLGNVCYSDYAEVEEDETLHKYPVRNNMGKDVKNIILSVQANSKTVMMDGAFAYAAVNADVITNTPVISDRQNSIDLEIPLYQLVFQGYKANSISSINTATNKRTQFLKAIETGSGLSFDLMANHYGELRKQKGAALYACLYEDNKELINEYVAEGKDYLASVAGSTIKAHCYVTADVTKTVFDNGVTVYVNYGDVDFVSDIGVVKAQDFLSKEGL